MFRLIMAFISKKNPSFPQFSLLWIQIQYYKRYFKSHNIKSPFFPYEKQAIHELFSLSGSSYKFFNLVSPQTILNSWKNAIIKHWSYPQYKKYPGRPRLTKRVKKLIKSMKIDNYLWGCRRIRDELLKLNIDVSYGSYPHYPFQRPWFVIVNRTCTF